MDTIDQRTRALAIIDTVFGFEGGVADVGDGKGVTRWGQTPAWLKRWGLPIPTTRDEARSNYLRWLELSRLVALCAHDGPLALIVIDWCVHSGETIPIRAMQHALGVTADGIIGPKTIAALEAADRNAIARKVLARRVAHGTKLVSDYPQDYQRYVEGWGNRWAELIERL